MKLVIEIPDELYNKIIENSKLYTVPYIDDVIAHGTPLPKGHGDLKDIEMIKHDILESNEFKWRVTKTFMGETLGETRAYDIGVIKKLIDNATTIIEADKEVEE